MEEGDDDISTLLLFATQRLVVGQLVGMVGEELLHDSLRDSCHAEFLTVGIPYGKIADKILQMGEGAE